VFKNKYINRLNDIGGFLIENIMAKKYKQNSNQINEIVNRCLVELAPLGIYVFNRAANTSSVYLKFNDSRLRSLTVRDHKTIPKYRYKWNIVLGYTGPKNVIDKGVVRFMYNETQLDDLFSHIKNYQKKINLDNKG
jgi:hypothetical protein